MDVTVTDDDLMQLFKEAQTAASAADPTVGGKLSVEISHYLTTRHCYLPWISGENTGMSTHCLHP
jgi:hypothetical protein